MNRRTLRSPTGRTIVVEPRIRQLEPRILPPVKAPPSHPPDRVRGGLVSPAQIRRDLNAAVSLVTGPVPASSRVYLEACQTIADTLEAHPWAHDQVPFDVQGIVRDALRER